MKKFLSLVLAVIMTMSLVTISAGATEYRDLTDKDEIQYEEAVAVLNRLGIITGYDDGSFRPDDELTRGAAAKIIVSLLIGPDAASSLTTPTAPYPDVPTTHTFAGVISFCKTSEIISGYGDGTFKPGNSLTGFAFAKMLLGALGYKSNIEGFVDTGWTQNVAKVGSVTGLFDRLDFDGAGAVNRETACQLALNTLKATMVTYGGTTVVTGANQQSYMVQGTQAMYVTSNNREINANINRRVINATNNEMTLEFGEEHFKDLRLEHDKYDPAYDIYGHPSNEWSYKKVTIGTFALEPDFKYTTQISHIEDTVATKEKALGLRGYDTYSTDHRANYTNWSSAAGGQYQYNSPFNDATQIHINGWNARVRNDDYPQGSYPANVDRDGQVYTYDASRIGASNKEEAPSLSEIADLTDNGVTVEVYVCPVDADFITDVVVTRTQLMKVDRITSDAIYMETITPDSTDVVRDAETLDEIAGYNDNALNKEVISVKDDNYDAYNSLKDMKAGDRMAIIPYTADDGKTWEVGEAYQPETVSGVLTNVDIYNTSRKPDGNAVAITVGGTTYPIAQWNKDMIDVSGPQIKATRKDVTLYLDKLGNAMWADEIGNSDAWMIVGDYYQATGVSSRVDWFVHGWTISGEEIDLDLGTIRGEAEKYAPGELVRYAISDGGNGEYTLTKPNYNGEYVLKQDYRPGNYPAMFQSGRSSEQPLLKDGESTGEGIYTVAQYAYQTGTNNSVQYNIKKGNDYIPLDRYNTQRDSANAPATVTGIRLNYSAVDSQNGISYDTTTDTVTAPGTFEAAWTYKIAPYDGVKFIFVGFDSSTGEVDTIDVVDGPVNVDYSDLIQINRYWRNVGTNIDNWVASPAEAYVNDKGLVKAVVIKNDAAEPSMSDYYIITDNKGSDTVVKSTGADAPTSGTYYTRQYVCGADGFKEEKTGYFDKALEVGTIITGRLGSDGVIKSRVFHANEYTNKNPDALYIKGIGRVMTLNNKVSESSFVVGSSTGNIVATVGTGRGYGHTLDVSTCDILGDEIVMGDTAVSNHSGLIKVDSATQFIDLRPGRPGDIKDLGDLLDYKNDSNVILKVLLNGNKSSDGFRRAYAVVILNATTAGANDVVIGSGSLMPVTDNNSGFVYATRNGIRYNTIAGLQRDLKVGDIVVIHVKPGFSIEVDKAGDPSYSSDADGNIATLTIPGDSSVPVVISKISDTTNPEPVTVTINNSTGKTVTVTFTNTANAADVQSGTASVTLTKGATYNVSISSADAANGYKVTPTTITADANKSVTVSKNPTGDVTITPIGVAGQTMTFKNSTTNETIKTATVGEEISLPTGVMMYVEADTNGYYACASRGGKPYGRNFLAENLDSVEVYLAGAPKTTFVLASDGETLSIKDIPAKANAKAASSEVEVEAATSIQNAPAGTGYWKISFEGGYILCEEGTGFDAGLLLIRGDTPQDYLDALLNVLVNDGELSTPEPISQEVYNKGYTGSVDPGPDKPVSDGSVQVLDKGTAPAVDVTASTTSGIYAYWGPDAVKAPVLTKEQVISAINKSLAARDSIRSIDLDKGTGLTTKGHAITLDKTAAEGTAPVAGSYQNPRQLFKVTIDGVDYYASGDKKVNITGLSTIYQKWLLEENLIATDTASSSDMDYADMDGLKTTNGVLTLSNLKKDVTLVSAVQYKGDSDGYDPFTGGTKLYALKNSKSEELSPDDYLQKDAELVLKSGNGAKDAGKAVSLIVNGSKVDGTYDQNGEFKFSFEIGTPADRLVIEVNEADKVFKVNYNGTPVAGTWKAGDVIPVTHPYGSTLIYETTTAGVYGATPTGNSGLTQDGYVVAQGNTTKSGGDTINLFDGYKVDLTSSPAFSAAKKLNAGGTDLSSDAGDAISSSAIYVPAGTEIYLKASSAKISLAVDTDEAPALTLTRLVDYDQAKEIIYKAVVNGDVSSTTVVKDVDLSTCGTATFASSTTTGASDSDPKTVTFTVTVGQVLEDAALSITWKQDAVALGLSDKATTIERTNDTTLTVTTQVSKQLSSGTLHAVVTANDVSSDLDVSVTS